MRSQCISRCRRTSSLPTTGMLFSAWQAITHAEQPVQALRSMPCPTVVRVFGMIVRPEILFHFNWKNGRIKGFVLLIGLQRGHADNGALLRPQVR